MFVSAKVHQQTVLKLETELAAERARRETLDRVLINHHALVGFLCARVNQLEAERALLFKHVTNIDIPMPQIAAAVPDPRGAAEAVGAATSLFEDMGDDAAKRLGVEWKNDGSVEYRGGTGVQH